MAKNEEFIRNLQILNHNVYNFHRELERVSESLNLLESCLKPSDLTKFKKEQKFLNGSKNLYENMLSIKSNILQKLIISHVKKLESIKDEALVSKPEDLKDILAPLNLMQMTLDEQESQKESEASSNKNSDKLSKSGEIELQNLKVSIEQTTKSINDIIKHFEERPETIKNLPQDLPKDLCHILTVLTALNEPGIDDTIIALHNLLFANEKLYFEIADQKPQNEERDEERDEERGELEEIQNNLSKVMDGLQWKQFAELSDPDNGFAGSIFHASETME